ncbi:MAG TPA: hypothetical protein VES01_08985 [Dermatophilaceae bacterium]|nr:hypothetical protein [Dermatophilaceae bacterium]
MTGVTGVLGILHWVGVAAILIGYALSVRRGAAGPVLVWAARAQLVLGMLLFAVVSGAGTERSNLGWLGLKFVISLTVVGLCEVGSARARQGDSQPALVHAAAGLTLTNVIIASLWR